MVAPAIRPGVHVGPYELLAPIGAGGMGEVWKARDTRLDRVVAIKFSQAAFSDRFQREARAIAALNHPNIATLHDVGENYLVMEYVDGEPLRVTDNSRKLLDIAAQMADGLAAAHAAGFVHRDLKPDNILLTRSGRVKILDFGLAKPSLGAAAGDATRTIGATDPGTIVGTTAYMSPEQARSQELDARSDQFSFGLILYELAAGKRAFQRPSAPETLAAIIRDEPEPLPASVHPPLLSTIERCLAKEADHRYDSTRDLYRELEQIRTRLTEATQAVAAPLSTRRNRRSWALLLAAGALGVIAGVALLWLLKLPAEVDLSGYRFTPITRDEGQEVAPEWSPDGKSIAYLAEGQLYTKLVGASNATQLTRQGGGVPFWSPDGATIYFLLRNTLWAVPASGGAPRMLHQPAGGAAVHPDGKTFAIWSDGHLSIGPLDSGQRRSYPLAGLPKYTFTQMRFSPDGSKIALRGGPIDNLWWILPYPQGAARKVGQGPGWLSGWFPDNRHLLLVNYDDRNASIVVMDAATGRQRTILRTAAFIANVSLAPDGRRIAYSTGSLGANLIEVSVPSGRTTPLLERGGASFDPDWAPSGEHYLFSSVTYGIAELEDRSAGDGLARRLVSSESDGMPADMVSMAGARWAPGGNRFLFVVRTPQSHQIYVANTSGGRPDLLDRSAGQSYSGAWSPDGEWIAYNREKDGKSQVVKIRGAGSQPVVIADSFARVAIEAGQFPVHWAKSGKWILYSAPEGLSIVSPDGASRRTLSNRRFDTYGFSREEDLVYAVQRDQQSRQWLLLSVNVASGAEKQLATLELPSFAHVISGFSLHSDGRRFAMSVIVRHRDIWMLEGFDQPRSLWGRLWPRMQ